MTAPPVPGSFKFVIGGSSIRNRPATGAMDISTIRPSSDGENNAGFWTRPKKLGYARLPAQRPYDAHPLIRRTIEEYALPSTGVFRWPPESFRAAERIGCGQEGMVRRTWGPMSVVVHAPACLARRLPTLILSMIAQEPERVVARGAVAAIVECLEVDHRFDVGSQPFRDRLNDVSGLFIGCRPPRARRIPARAWMLGPDRNTHLRDPDRYVGKTTVRKNVSHLGGACAETVCKRIPMPNRRIEIHSMPSRKR